MEIQNNISKTALYTCAIRARENEYKLNFLKDSYAHLFIGEQAKTIYKELRKYRMSSLGVCVRHKIIDDLITEAAIERPIQVINIGCGLDTRPYRIGKNVKNWLEVDTPDIITYKNERLSVDKAQCSLKRIPINFEKESIATVIKPYLLTEANIKTYVLLEGVLMYLNEEIINQTFNSIKEVVESPIFIVDLMTKDFFNKKVKSLEKGIRKIGAPFTYLPESKEQFLQAVKMKEIKSVVVTHFMVSYILPWIKLKWIKKGFSFFNQVYEGLSVLVFS